MTIKQKTAGLNETWPARNPIFHLLGSCKFRRHEPEPQTIAVNRERQIAKHPLRVSQLLGF